MSHQAFIGQGSNSSLVGDFNGRVVLAALRRRGPASKADLSRLVGLTSNATGLIVRRLEEDGLVRATGKRRGSRGQPATILELNPDGAYSIGVRVDRNRLETVLVDLSGIVLRRDLLEYLPDPAETVRYLADVVAGMVAALAPSRRRRLAGIGIAMPYDLASWLDMLDLPAGRFRAWTGFDLRAALAQATGQPVMLENDGSAAAVGEMIHGRGRGLRDFLYLFIGPAIGGGLVLDGDYVRGRRGNAGDVGVIPVPASRLDSVPAGQGPTILLARASMAALQRHLRFHGAEGDPQSHPRLLGEWLDDAAEALAVPVMTAAHLLDLPAVVIGGDLPTPVLEALRNRLAVGMLSLAAESRSPPSVWCGTTGPAAAVGAASLPLYNSFSPQRDGLTGPAANSEEIAP